MRYSKNESTYILAHFDSGDSVTITIYRLSDGSAVVNGDSCSEVASTGIFAYNFQQTITQKEEYLWIMTNGSYSKYGKIVLGGWMDNVKEKIDSNLDVAVSTRSNHNPSDVADAVWNEPRNEHTTTGTFGNTDEWAGQIDIGAIADAVWDENILEHNKNANTFGYKVTHISSGMTKQIIQKELTWTKNEKEMLLNKIIHLEENLNQIKIKNKQSYALLQELIKAIKTLITNYNMLEQKLSNTKEKDSNKIYKNINKSIEEISKLLIKLMPDEKLEELISDENE